MFYFTNGGIISEQKRLTSFIPCGTYCHKTGTRQPNCVTPLQPTINVQRCSLLMTTTLHHDRITVKKLALSFLDSALGPSALLLIIFSKTLKKARVIVFWRVEGQEALVRKLLWRTSYLFGNGSENCPWHWAKSLHYMHVTSFSSIPYYIQTEFHLLITN